MAIRRLEERLQGHREVRKEWEVGQEVARRRMCKARIQQREEASGILTRRQRTCARGGASRVGKRR